MYLTTSHDDFAQECLQRSSFKTLGELALAELSKFPGDVEIVCGPITTGGAGTEEKNLTIFNAVIQRLLRQGRPVFNQMPYEKQLFALRDAWLLSEANKGLPGYNPVLELFYRPLFMEMRFTKAWFIPGWETSSGAKWERNLLQSLGVEFQDLSDTWVNGALSGVT